MRIQVYLRLADMLQLSAVEFVQFFVRRVRFKMSGIVPLPAKWSTGKSIGVIVEIPVLPSCAVPTVSRHGQETHPLPALRPLAELGTATTPIDSTIGGKVNMSTIVLLHRINEDASLVLLFNQKVSIIVFLADVTSVSTVP